MSTRLGNCGAFKILHKSARGLGQVLEELDRVSVPIALDFEFYADLKRRLCHLVRLS